MSRATTASGAGGDDDGKKFHRSGTVEVVQKQGTNTMSDALGRIKHSIVSSATLHLILSVPDSSEHPVKAEGVAHPTKELANAYLHHFIISSPTDVLWSIRLTQKLAADVHRIPCGMEHRIRRRSSCLEDCLLPFPCETYVFAQSAN